MKKKEKEEFKLEDIVTKDKIFDLGKISITGPKITLDAIRALKKSQLDNDMIVDRQEIRYIVSIKNQIQDYRISLNNQLKSIEAENEGNCKDFKILSYLYESVYTLEKNIISILEAFTDSVWIGRWCKENMGIGAVLSAELIAYFDITKANYAGQFWSYAGLNDNNNPWLGKEKSTKLVEEVMGKSRVVTDEHLSIICERTHRTPSNVIKSATDEKTGKITRSSLIKGLSKIPYNAELKTICWKVGEQFLKLKNNPKSLYGRLLKERLIHETQLNDNGEYAEQAKNILENKNFSTTTEAYKALSQGKLPKAQLLARAKRYAVKVFISHLHEAMYIDYYKKESPVPYVIGYMGHVDYIGPEVSFDSIK